MTTYSSSAVSDTVIAFKKPITLQQGRALRNNLLAVTEGDTTAPYIQHVWHPYNGTFWNDGNTGRIWSFAVNGALSTITSPDFADGYEYAFAFDAVEMQPGASLTFNFYAETDAAYAGALTVGTAAPSGSPVVYGRVTVPLPRFTSRLFRAYPDPYLYLGLATNSLSPNYTGDAVMASRATAQKILRVQIATSGGNFTAGSIFMLRRRAY